MNIVFWFIFNLISNAFSKKVAVSEGVDESCLNAEASLSGTHTEDGSTIYRCDKLDSNLNGYLYSLMPF